MTEVELWDAYVSHFAFNITEIYNARLKIFAHTELAKF